MSSFSTVPDLGTDKPACVEDNQTFFDKDDNMFYIHYKHPVFARIMTSTVSSGASGLIPTLLSANNIQKGKLPNIKRSAPKSFQNFAELGYLAFKAKKEMNKPNSKFRKTVKARFDLSLPPAIRAPLELAVNIIGRSASLINFGQKRVLGGSGTRKNLKRKH